MFGMIKRNIEDNLRKRCYCCQIHGAYKRGARKIYSNILIRMHRFGPNATNLYHIQICISFYSVVLQYRKLTNVCDSF